MESPPRIRQATTLEKCYKEPEVCDDVESESETEDQVEEQLNDSDEETVEMDIERESENDSLVEEEQTASSKKRKRLSFLHGKNNFKWSLNPPESHEEQSVMTPEYLPKPKGRAATVTTPLEAWSTFFDEDILNIILQHTNEQIQRELDKIKTAGRATQSYHKSLDMIELKAVLGLLYFSGLQKISNNELPYLWSHFGMRVFRATMSEQRFTFILSCIRFDDKNTRKKRKKSDNFTHIHQIWDKFITNCTANYDPGVNCTIDDQLLPFTGRCKFRMHMPAKPDTHGIKIVALNDTVTHYLFNAIPYCGLITEKKSTQSMSSYYIRKLTELINNTGRNITCNGWFMSVPICDELLKNKLTMVGTVYKDKKEIPETFKSISSTHEKARFAYDTNKTLVSFNPKGKKIALLISSLHKKGEIDEESGKPKIVLFYNDTKGGTRRFDSKCRDYSVARKTRRWPLRIFYGMLDQANVNSFIIYNLLASNKLMNRRQFMLSLSLDMIKPFLIHRLTNRTLQTTLRIEIESYLKYEEIPEDQDPKHLIPENRMSKYKHCGYCPVSLNRTTMFRCLKCRLPMCKEHTAKICEGCSTSLL